jgi:hypothetical protein
MVEPVEEAAVAGCFLTPASGGGVGGKSVCVGAPEARALSMTCCSRARA